MQIKILNCTINHNWIDNNKLIQTLKYVDNVKLIMLSEFSASRFIIHSKL